MSVQVPGELGAALRRLAREAARFGAGKLGAWQQQAKGEAQPAGAIDRAVVAGLRALVTGDNPVPAALKAAWQGAGAGTRTAWVAVLLLVAVTAPVLLLLVLLAVLLIALVLQARRALGTP
jgi:hypothetical protein